jgi:hypothetical protein
MSDDLFPITLADMIICVEREIRFRERVYPRQVAGGRLTETKAAREIEIMRTVKHTLEGLKGASPDRT